MIGHLLDDPTRVERIAALFTAAGFDATAAPSLRQARWEKLIWNIPYNSLTVTAGGCTTREIMDDPGLRGLARTLMEETITAGNADGCAIDREQWIEKMMSNTDTMGRYRPSMVIDFAEKRPMEVESILGEPTRRAERLGVAVPHIAMQYRLVSFLDKWNRGAIRCEG